MATQLDTTQLAQAFARLLNDAAAGGGLVKKASGTPISTYAYNTGGLFGVCSTHPWLINAMVGPMGYEGKLNWFGSETESENVQSLTYIGSSGYDQTGKCGDCGTPTIRRCAQTTCFGRICQSTEEMAFDELGLKANVNVPQLAIYGNLTDPAGNVLIRQGERVTNMFTLHVAAAAYNLRRRVGTMLWSGNPTANAGGYAEFPGFDLWINTGKSDALTGLACNALDSVISNYGSAVVGATGSPSIVNRVAGIIRSIRYRIMTSGFDPASAAIDIVMHPTLWDCVASAFACEYGLSCQSTSASISMENNALEIARLRDEFLNNEYIRVDGRNYPVTLDNGITVTNSPHGNETKRCSTLYVITRELAGAPNGGVITYGQYQDMMRTGGDVIAWFQRMFGARHVQVTDGGRYAVAPTTYGGFCFDARVLVKPRVVMLMPQLSGRITNVCCVPTGTYPDVTGSGGTYEVDGGASTTIPPYLYGDCWPTHVGS